MKKLISMLLVLMLPLSACAELSFDSIAAATAQPAGIQFACDAFTVTLPFGFEVLSESAIEGYEAAVERDYPAAAQTLLVSSSADRSASIYFASTQSAQDPLDAAREASLNILGSEQSASERIYGENRFGYFACAAENLTYQTFFFAAGSSLLTIVACNLSEAELSAMLESLQAVPLIPVP